MSKATIREKHERLLGSHLLSKLAWWTEALRFCPHGQRQPQVLVCRHVNAGAEIADDAPHGELFCGKCMVAPAYYRGDVLVGCILCAVKRGWM